MRSKSETFRIIKSWVPKAKDNPDGAWDLSYAGLYHLPLNELDLSGVNLSGANLSQSNFDGSNFANSNLSRAKLSDTWIQDSDFSGAILSAAEISHAKLLSSKFKDCSFEFSNVENANFHRTVIIGGIWKNVDFKNSVFDNTFLADVDLSSAKNLDTITHRGRSTIGFDTIFKSGTSLSEKFLSGCGVPSTMIESVLRIFDLQKENKVFLSYTQETDTTKKWIDKFALDLNSQGVFVYYDKWDVAPGDSLTKFMDTGIDQSKFGIFICTPESSARANQEHKWTGYEAMQFKVGLTKQNKTIIPILLAGTEENIPRYLQSLRYVDMRRLRDYKSGLSEIVSLVIGKSRRPPLGRI